MQTFPGSQLQTLFQSAEDMCVSIFAGVIVVQKIMVSNLAALVCHNIDVCNVSATISSA